MRNFIPKRNELCSKEIRSLFLITVDKGLRKHCWLQKNKSCFGSIMMKADRGENGEGGWGTVLTLYQRFSDDLQSYPSVPPTHHQSWEVCRGRRRAHRTKVVPSPTSPLLHNTPKAGNCLGQRSSWTVLGCGLTLVLFVPPRHPQPFNDLETVLLGYAVCSTKWWVERPLLDYVT